MGNFEHDYVGSCLASLWVCRQEGHGVYVSVDGSRYEGQWSAGKMHGQGRYVWPDRFTFEGEFVNGERSGVAAVLPQALCGSMCTCTLTLNHTTLHPTTQRCNSHTLTHIPAPTFTVTWVGLDWTLGQPDAVAFECCDNPLCQ